MGLGIRDLTGRRRRRPWLLAALVAAAAGLAGCGSSGQSASQGSTLRVTFSAFPDYLDPSIAYSLEGATAMAQTYIPLLTYVRADGVAGTRLMPGLARSMPRVTDGGRTYTLSLRPGLRYSDGTPVRASDFRATIERVLAMNSAGSPFYTSIVGAERFARTKHGGIPGIVTDDRSGRIVIHLVKPRSTFANELAAGYAAPLPADTPREDLSAHPPPGTGPYEIVESKPGKGWRYRRNPEWAKTDGPLMPRISSGHYAAIEVDVIANAETAVNEVIHGRIDWMDEPPPPDRYAELRERYGGQLLVTPQIDLYYFWMNVDVAPFDDLRVRRAVNYAIDPAALARIYAGSLRPVQQVLPPAMPGHRDLRLYPHDMAKARELIAAADPAVRKVTVWTNSYPTNRQAGEYYEGVLGELGFEPTLKVLSPTNFLTVIGNGATPDLDTGLANWYMDYPHPNDYFQPQLSSGSIKGVGNTNYSRFKDPRIDRRIARLGTEALGPRQEAAYAALDREVMSRAPWAPFGSVPMSNFVAAGIDTEALVISPVYGADLTSFAPR